MQREITLHAISARKAIVSNAEKRPMGSKNVEISKWQIGLGLGSQMYIVAQSVLVLSKRYQDALKWIAAFVIIDGAGFVEIISIHHFTISSNLFAKISTHMHSMKKSQHY